MVMGMRLFDFALNVYGSVFIVVIVVSFGQTLSFPNLDDVILCWNSIVFVADVADVDNVANVDDVADVDDVNDVGNRDFNSFAVKNPRRLLWWNSRANDVN